VELSRYRHRHLLRPFLDFYKTEHTFTKYVAYDTGVSVFLTQHSLHMFENYVNHKHRGFHYAVLTQHENVTTFTRLVFVCSVEHQPSFLSNASDNSCKYVSPCTIRWQDIMQKF
jgi:hypothetical protein